MSKTVLLFPGQASQYVGMAKDLHEESSEVRQMYELASAEIGADIARLSFEGPAEELKRTRFTQPAILLHSLSVLKLLGDNLPQFDFAAGHSLGEYGALAVTGALSFEDAIKAVVKRASLMEEACLQNPGTMAAVMGLAADKVKKVCDEVSSSGVVVPANINSSSQLVISGEIPAVKKAAEAAKAAGAKRALLLEVGGAFHSPLMGPAKDGLEAYLADVKINSADKPVIANVTGQAESDSEKIRQLLVEQVLAPVQWAQTMTYLKDNNVTTVIEVGPGKVLTGLAKREIRPERSISLDTLEDIKAFTAVPA